MGGEYSEGQVGHLHIKDEEGRPGRCHGPLWFIKPGWGHSYSYIYFVRALFCEETQRCFKTKR